MENKEKEYSAKIIGTLKQMFNEESEFSIDMEEFEEGENLTIFIHALANIAPMYIYNELIGDNKKILQFNHLANQLCFQFLTKAKTK